MFLSVVYFWLPLGTLGTALGELRWLDASEMTLEGPVPGLCAPLSQILASVLTGYEGTRELRQPGPPDSGSAWASILCTPLAHPGLHTVLILKHKGTARPRKAIVGVQARIGAAVHEQPNRVCMSWALLRGCCK